jgi:hypothetical protein
LCFVRNPWDRLVSAYQYLRQGHRHSPIVGLLQSGSFTDFVKGALRSPVVWRELHIKPQHFFVVDRQERLRMAQNRSPHDD